jgi:hypothetical protein
MVAFTHFANKFDENITNYVNSVAHSGEAEFSTHIEFVNKNKDEIDSALMLAYKCGGSFQEWRSTRSIEQPPFENCNDVIASKFDRLSEKFWIEVPLWDALKSRRDSLWKVLSKSDLENKAFKINKNTYIKYFLFKYRLVLLIIGFIAIIYLLKQKNIEYEQKLMVGSLLLTAVAFYALFCLIMVQAEMRYLLTPDILISILSGLIPVAVIRKIRCLRLARRSKHLP